MLIKKMINLDCFLKEYFRHSSDIATLPHAVIGDSYTFSNGTTVPKNTAFNNKFFGETSNDFQPKRHITSYSNGKTIHSPATKVDRSFITFGGGKHACPGRFFAVNEIKMCLHKLILNYNIRTESGKIVPPIKMSSFKIPPIGGKGGNLLSFPKAKRPLFIKIQILFLHAGITDISASTDIPRSARIADISRIHDITDISRIPPIPRIPGIPPVTPN
ncbi:cytochrome P450 [Gigaspora rosea]|uniref:Cytochrome P450 n=1 Tax=Gigaspora rosea TaxID=44941 RepID=A0A397UM37_9GLOM|nr:cytochrome P450 [Gigaspora rosea]